MMKFLVPLGLLGLIGILVLIIIYIIKPNYQNKYITSTYVWKLSLRYKKRRPPTSKLRNILLFICQILILTAMAGIMAWPALVEEPEGETADYVYILDSSASMYAGNADYETRFSRAVKQISDEAEGVFNTGGKVSLIVAERESKLLFRRVDATSRDEFSKTLMGLQCTYASADIEKALTMSRDILGENPLAQLYLYTDTTYEYIPEKVHVVNMQAEGDWNAAILGAEATREDGFYVITVSVALYGNEAMEIPLSIAVSGANGESNHTIRFNKFVLCEPGETNTVIFRLGGGKDDENLFYSDIGDLNKFSSFTSVTLTFEADDSFDSDNNYYLYGGDKEVLNVQYASADPNPFLPAALYTARNMLSSRYDFRITEVKKGVEPALEGFDFYIFEHTMPSALPTDGFVLLADPDPMWQSSVPAGAGFRVSQAIDLNGNRETLAEGEDFAGHPVAENIIADDITVSRYCKIEDVDPAYRVLLSYGGDPVYMVRNDGAVKMAVMGFSVHYSNISKLIENPLLMRNLLDYFFPAIVSGNSFEVGEEFTVNTWGSELEFSDTGETFTEEDLPAQFMLDVPGTYTFRQRSYFEDAVAQGIKKEFITAQVFISIPAYESDILRRTDSLSDPYEGTETETDYKDLLLYLASALVAFLFVEWWLHSRESK